MITARSLTLKGKASELDFEFDSGVLCLVTNKKDTEDGLYALILAETSPDNGDFENGFKNISYCSASLPPELKVKDYLKFIAKCKKSELPEYSIQLTEEIYERYIRYLTQYEKLTVAIAGALIGEPELILMQSPSRGLEPSDIRKLGAMIDSLREYTSVIYSSEVPTLFREHSDKILFVSDTKQLYFGDSTELCALTEQDGGLFVKAKGDMDAAAGVLGGEHYTFEYTEKPGIFTIRCADGEANRLEIRKTLQKMGMAILEMKADNEALKNIFKSLSSAEEAMAESEEEKEAEEDENTPKTLAEIVAFSHDSDESDEAEIEKTEADEPEKAVKKPSITISFAHIEEDDE